jgi:hypothetical protein
LGKWFPTRCSGLAKRLVLRKATNLEQVGRTGDGNTSRFIDKTLKAPRLVQPFASCEGKNLTGNAMSGWPG